MRLKLYLFALLGASLSLYCNQQKLSAQELKNVNFTFGPHLAAPSFQRLTQSIQKELGMEQYPIEVRKFSKKGLEQKTPALTYKRSHIFVDEKEFATLTKAEQRFLIGHELIHIRNNHIAKRNLLGGCIYFGGPALSFIGGIALYLKLRSMKTTKNIFKPDTYAYTHVFTHYEAFYISYISFLIPTFFSALLSICAKGTCSRSQEEEADCYAAHELNCALGGCLFFLRKMIQSNSFSIKNGSFDSHPTHFKRFINLMLISGDHELYALASQQDKSLKEPEKYFKDIYDYLIKHVT